tara:strand:+ start:1886 stop:2083 length:198 start_codon:yes stop_codon:yes gene_type:complete
MDFDFHHRDMLFIFYDESRFFDGIVLWVAKLGNNPFSIQPNVELIHRIFIIGSNLESQDLSAPSK